MPLLSEYVITPDVLFSCFYSSSELEEVLVNQVANTIMASGLVRDLRNGEWSELLNSPECHLNPRSKEFIKMLKKERRLRVVSAALPVHPVTASDWCQEALASHQQSYLSGIITTKSVAEQFKSEHRISSINNLGNGSVEWWQPLQGNIEIRRDIRSYLLHLKPILDHANSLLFIDPHLDPSSRKSYANFPKIIKELTKRERFPSMVQFHRQGEWDKINERWTTIEEWETRFKNVFLPIIKGTRLKIDVFIWKDFHDRYLLSDLAGIQMSNGFDEKNPNQPIEITTWSRLGKELTANRYCLFDPASRRKDLVGRFMIG